MKLMRILTQFSLFLWNFPEISIKLVHLNFNASSSYAYQSFHSSAVFCVSKQSIRKIEKVLYKITYFLIYCRIQICIMKKFFSLFFFRRLQCDTVNQPRDSLYRDYAMFQAVSPIFEANTHFRLVTEQWGILLLEIK